MADAEITVLLSVMGSAAGAVSALQQTDRALEATARRMMIFGREAWVIGASLTAAITAPLVGLGTAAVVQIAKFDDAMHKAAAISTYTKQNFDAVAKSIVEMSKTYGRSATELASALYFIHSAGIEGEKAMEMLAVAAKAAVAGMTKPEVVIRGLVAVMSAYKDTNLTVQQAADILFRTVDRGILTFEELVSSIANVAPAAAVARVSLSDLGAAYILMTRAGFSAAEAGVAVNRMILEFFDPSAKGAKLAKQLGVEFSAQALISKGLGGVIADLTKKIGLYEIVERDMTAGARQRMKQLSAQHAQETAAARERILNLDRQRDALRAGEQAEIDAIQRRQAALRAERAAAGVTRERRKQIDAEIRQLEANEKAIRARGKSLDSTARNERRNLTALRVEYQKQRSQLMAASLAGTTYEKVLTAVSKRLGVSIEQARTLFPDVRALRAWLVLSADGGRDFAEAQEEMQAAMGATDRVFKEQRESLVEYWNRFIQTMNAVALNMRTLLEPSLIRVIEALRKTVDWFDRLDDESKLFLIRIAAIAAAIGPLLATFGTLIRLMGLSMFAFAGMRRAILALVFRGGIFGLIALGAKIAALISLVFVFRRIWETNFMGLRTRLTPIINSIAKALFGILPPGLQKEVKRFVKEAFPDLMKEWGPRISPFTDWFEDFIDRLEKWTKPVVKLWDETVVEWQFVFTMLKQVIWDSTLKPIFKWIGAEVPKLSAAWEKGFSPGVVQGLRDFLRAVGERLVQLDTFIRTADWKGFFEKVKDVVLAVRDAFVALWDRLSKVDWEKVWQGFIDVVGHILKVLREIEWEKFIADVEDVIKTLLAIDWKTVFIGFMEAAGLALKVIREFNDLLDRLNIKGPFLLGALAVVLFREQIEAALVALGGFFFALGFAFRVFSILGVLPGLFMMIQTGLLNAFKPLGLLLVKLGPILLPILGSIEAAVAGMLGRIGTALAGALLKPSAGLLAIAAPLALLAIIGYSVWKNWDLVKEVWNEVFDPIRQKLLEIISQQVDEIKESLQKLGDTIDKYLGPPLRALGDVLEKIVNKLKEWLAEIGVLQFLQDLGDAIRNAWIEIEKFAADLDKCIALGTAWGVFLYLIVFPLLLVIGFLGLLRGAIDLLTAAIETLLRWGHDWVMFWFELGVACREALEALPGEAQKAWDQFTADIQSFWQRLSGWFETIITGIIAFGGRFLSGGATLIGNLISGLSTRAWEVANAVWKALSEAWKTITGWGAAFLSAAGSLIGQVVSGISTRAWEIANKIWHAIRDAYNTITGWGESLFNAGANIIGQIIAGIRSKWEEFLSWIDGLRKLLPGSAAEIGPFKKLPDWSVVWEGLSPPADWVQGLQSELAILRAGFAPAPGRQFAFQPAKITVYIGDREIKDVSMEWSYEALRPILERP